MDISSVVEENETYENRVPIERERILKKNIDGIKRNKIKHLVLPPYLPYNTIPEDLEELKTKWENVLKVQNEALASVLKLDFYSFWSQIICDESLTHFLDTYLRFKTRSYDQLSSSSSPKNTETMKRLEQDLYKRVFMILLRLSMSREQQQYSGQYDQLTLDEYSDIVHSLWIFDVPKLFDICALYTGSNPKLTRRLVTSVFLSQPKYLADLVSHAQLLSAAIKSVAKQTWQLRLEYYRFIEGKNQSSPRKKKNDIISKSMEIIYYLNDLVNTVNHFLSVFNYGVFAFRINRVQFDTGFHFLDSMNSPKKQDNENIDNNIGSHNNNNNNHYKNNQKFQFLRRLALIYEFIIPTLQNTLSSIVHSSNEHDNNDDQEYNDQSILYSRQIRYTILQIFDRMLSLAYLQHIPMKRSSTEHRTFELNDYFSGIGRTDLYAKHRILDEISGRQEIAESPLEACREMEAVIMDLIETTVTQLKNDVIPSEKEKEELYHDDIFSITDKGFMLLHYNRMFRFYKEMHWRRGAHKIETSRIKKILSTLTTLEKGVESEFNGTDSHNTKEHRGSSSSSSSSSSFTDHHKHDSGTVAQLQNPSIKAKVDQVRELLPHFNEVFIMQCLEYFEFSAEQVINNIMENNLPPNLKSFMDSGAAESQDSWQSSSSVENPSSSSSSSSSSSIPSTSSSETVLPKWLRIKSAKRKQKQEFQGFKQQKGKKKISMDMDEDERALLNQRILESYMYEDEYDDTFEENVKFGMGEGEAETEEGDHDNTFIKLVSEHDNDTEQPNSDNNSEKGKEQEQEKQKDNTASNSKNTSSSKDQIKPKENTSNKTNNNDQNKRKKGKSGTGKGRGRGRGGGGGGYGAGMSEREKHNKQKNKAKVANHDRKKQAAKKANKAMPRF